MASGWRLRRPALPTLGEAAASGFVGSVRGIAPLSCLLLLGLLLQLPLARAAPLALQAWAAAEVLFLGWYRFHLAQLQPPAIGPPMTKAQRQQAFVRALAATSDLRRFVSGWFKLAPFSAIRTGNAKEWLAWAVFGSRLEALGAAEQQEVVGMLGAFEAALGAKLPAGYNPSLREGCIRINLDPISAQHRPVISYVVTYTAHAVGWALLRRQGFRRSRCGALCYWHRPASEPAAEPGRPIVLLHGIGLGLVPYLGLLDRLITAHGAACPILLPEFPHISQKIGGPPPPAAERDLPRDPGDALPALPGLPAGCLGRSPAAAGVLRRALIRLDCLQLARSAAARLRGLPALPRPRHPHAPGAPIPKPNVSRVWIAPQP